MILEVIEFVKAVVIGVHQKRKRRGVVDKVRSYNRGYTARDDAIELQPTIKRVCCTLNAELLEKTNFHLVCPPKLLVRADKLELELMLSNLLKNALEASNETPYPVVTLEAFSQDKKIFIRIENSGRLLTEDDVRRLTTPLLTTKATGLGLGVTIACALAEACGGQVQFKARPEGGLIAFITLLDAKNAPEHRSST
jgi:two-component system, LuxR family, sensor histidine kinase TtrS